MTRVKIAQLRDHASEYIRRVAGGETIIILRRDREVAKLVPLRTEPGAGRLLGCLQGSAEVVGDLEEPIVLPEEWFRS